MTEDELALLRTIREHPDADLPRLVYADWLEERGHERQAEFIRLQIDRYHHISTDPTARGIGWREYEILLEHELLWKAELPPGFRTGAAFRRGLIHRVSCRVRDLFATPAEALVAPVEELTVVVDELNLEWLVTAPAAFRLPLRELTIECRTPVGPVLADTLAKFGPFPRLRTLRIHDRHFGNSGAATLFPLPAFPEVRHLDLTNCGLTDAFAGAVVDSGWLNRLGRLTIAGNDFQYDVATYLHNLHPNVTVG